MGLLSRTAFCFQLIVLSMPNHAQSAPIQGAIKPPGEFVQKFYDWYVPKALGDNGGPAWGAAIKQKHRDFSSQLAQTLGEDLTAQSNSSGEIVGLDFDPFLNSQDPMDRYQVGEVVQKNGVYLVNVYGMQSGKRGEKPDVIAEVIEKDCRWEFENFHYQDGKDLISLLKELREGRHKARR